MRFGAGAASHASHASLVHGCASLSNAVTLSINAARSSLSVCAGCGGGMHVFGRIRFLFLIFFSGHFCRCCHLVRSARYFAACRRMSCFRKSGKRFHVIHCHYGMFCFSGMYRRQLLVCRSLWYGGVMMVRYPGVCDFIIIYFTYSARMCQYCKL